MRIGEKVEARAKELRMGPTELARKIKSTKQNVYDIYKRHSIDTALLQRLGKVLEFDFFIYFHQANAVHQPRPPYGKQKKVVSETEAELEQLQKEHDELRQKFELLKELYELKTGKKVPGSF
jgi:hypothetical protein